MSTCENGILGKNSTHYYSETFNNTWDATDAPLCGLPTTNIKLLLFKRLAEKVQERQVDQREVSEVSIKKLFEWENQNKQENYRKKEIVDITNTELDVIEYRIKTQQEEFERHKLKLERNKIKKILSCVYYVTEEEASYALKECKNEEEAILRLSDNSLTYLNELRKKIAFTSKAIQLEAPSPMKKRMKGSRIATQLAREKLGTYVRSRLSLNEAIQQLEKSANLDEAMKDWSPARIRAYLGRKENPNAYYYRFNDPGEKQRNGKWDAHEEKLFFTRLKELGANGQWGIFSMAIPGRVGYQCSNFYRKLLKEKRVVDSNYFFDEKGNSHYKFKGKDGNFTKSFKQKTGEEDFYNGSKASRGASSRGWRKLAEDTSSDEGSAVEDDWKPDRSFFTTKRLRLKHGELNEDDKAEIPNPLPNFIDPITLEEVVMPAISPAGHVMSYSSWVQCIENNGLCPLTKQRVETRELVVLTPENINEYRHKIVNHM
ncbi:uncharacterized protein LOC135145874 isoform X2 [Zophobas morio]|uniref:uncharacterized protein LOC135145874 isoform X2 n=1 Tax=Zophobas morio TaxID=2755281 RepID=UPI0030829B40